MARKKKNTKEIDFFDETDNSNKTSFWHHPKTDTTQTIVSICLIVFGILIAMAGFAKAGKFGEWFYHLFDEILFGVGFWLMPIILLMLGFSLLRFQNGLGKLKTAGGILAFVSGLGIISLLNGDGGNVGSWIAQGLEWALGIEASLVVLTAFVIIALILIFQFSWKDITSLFHKKTLDEELEEMNEQIYEEEELDKDTAVKVPVQSSVDKDRDDSEKDRMDKNVIKDLKDKIAKKDNKDNSVDIIRKPREEFGRVFLPPPLTLLSADKGRAGSGDMKANAVKIQQTLRNFNITVEIAGITPGPSVTQYAIKPAQGIKLTKITALQNDLALALAAHPLRIEAPIPGKSLVGIEIPNSTKTTVGLRTLFESADFQNSTDPLFVSLGKDIYGKAHFTNLAKMPHLLVAGTTGSGKSVMIHTLITSLLYRNSPDDLKFIMVDPKMVEMTLYKGIPHLLTPVITQAKGAMMALRWATTEMDRRYGTLEAHSVNNIQSYHKNVLIPYLKDKKDSEEETEDGAPERMPYIVIVIDEMADLMSSFPKEIEAPIVRLAQKGRAAGIHIVLSTQSPRKEVITGLIKSNIPATAALRVRNYTESGIIMGENGAESLLGQGDMLYKDLSTPKPVRLQSAFISENEIKDVVSYLKRQYEDVIQETIALSNDKKANRDDEVGVSTISMPFDPIKDMERKAQEAEDIGDDKYEEAKEAVISARKASTSFLQRKLGVGYSRAAKLIDILEEQGVVGPANGSKPREILLEADGYSAAANSSSDTEAETDGVSENN